MPAVKSRTIDSDVRDALASIEWEGALARLACGTLDRKVYVKVNDALESLGGKWNRKAKAHVFDGDAQDALEAVIETGQYQSAFDAKRHFGEFETPDGLADKAAALLHLPAEPVKILEPSAGGGQLVKALRRASRGDGDAVVAVEIQEKRRNELSCIADEVMIADFLDTHGVDFGADEPFDAVLMNPPFARQADIDHVMHALKFLKPGGRLVSIMSPGWTFRENAKSREFRALVESQGEWHANALLSFKESGTDVNTVTVCIDK